MILANRSVLRQMKIGVLADTHVGRSIPRAIGWLRRQAYRHAFTQAIDIFIQEGVVCLIHAGDMFEKRSMTPEDSVFVKGELQRLADSISDRYHKEVAVFAVRGNHDGTPENNALDYIKHPLAKYLRIIGDEILQGKAESQTLNDLCLVGVAYHPYISRKFEELKPIIQKNFAQTHRLRVLVVHNFVRGHHHIPPGVPSHNWLDTRDLSELGADVVISGHHHTRKESTGENGTVLLTPGATEAIDLSDEGVYGVYILEGKNSNRFIPIRPLHEIRNIKVDSQGTVKSTGWFADMGSEEARAYSSSVRERNAQGILRLVLLGLSDGDPYRIEQHLTAELTKIKDATPGLLHIELVNRVEDSRLTLTHPTLGKADDFTAEILKPLAETAPEALKLIEEVSMALDEKASQTTGLLTGSDRAEFLPRWIKIFERSKKRV